ncbi:MAG: hypothetical protein CMP49_00760 [Flavobacteriales bacterium]|nr:hypothetical protein [Flavobacteriales bacterium]|tara:strand:- start:22990 stop:24153 length:1164 start_codon:yes stop_codon:yes gene_type:complete
MRKAIISFFLLVTFFSNAQNYDKLIEQKKNLVKESQYLNNLLTETKFTQKHTLEALSLLNNKIEVQQNLYNVLTEETEFLKKDQQKIERRLSEILIELEILKENYSNLIEVTHKSLRGYNRLLFFLSSTNFNQLTRRVFHFRELEINRRKKYKEIEILQQEVELKNKKIIKKKAEQSDLAFHKKKELLELRSLRTSKEATISILENKEDSLINAIKIKESETNKITSAILSMIESKNNNKNNLTPEAKLIGDNFISNKGQLPWPVSTGIVISKFGNVPHPVLSGIKIMNNGIEISTNNNIVRSVFKGEVSKIIVLPTGLKVIIIKHGKYLTVYSNIYTVKVKKGDFVNTKQEIGHLYKNKSKKNNVLGFQIWEGREKLNPSHWISSY